MDNLKIKTLHPLEVKTILHYKPYDVISSKSLQDDLGFNIGQANQVINWLAFKKILKIKEKKNLVSYELTAHGDYPFKYGLIELEILNELKKNKNSLEEIKEKLQKTIEYRYEVLNKEFNDKKDLSVEFKKIYDSSINRNFKKKFLEKLMQHLVIY